MRILALAISGRGLVDPDEPVVHVDDEAFMRGRGAFETLRVYGGRPFRLAEHLVRLEESSSRLGLPTPPREEVKALVADAIEAAAAPEAMLRIYLTPGREAEKRPIALVVLAELPGDLDELRERGIRLVPVEFQPARLIGGVKSTSYALNMIALDRAKADGADDAVFLSSDGTVLEATTSNIWWRRGRTLRTPSLDLGILAGVTRATLVELAASLGYQFEAGAYPVSALAAAEEAFTTSSVREVMPVVALDGSEIPLGEAAVELQIALREAACR